MRVAVVSATYVQGLSYQENVWAEELALLGHRARVFRADARGGPTQTEVIDGHPYEICPVRTLMLPRGILPSARLAESLLRFAPDLVLWFGVPMYFGRALFTDPRLADLRVAAFFSLNSAMHTFDWRTPGAPLRDRALALAFRALRSHDVVRGCLRAEVVVANTPETRDILLRFPRGGDRDRIATRIAQIPLGFSPRHFRFDPARRRAARAELAVGPGEVLVGMSSRFAPNKVWAIEQCLGAIGVALGECRGLRALLVGFDDGPVSARFRRQIETSGIGSRCILRGFAGRDRLSRLYHAADVMLFAQPSISCQESLGTGAYVVFADDGSTDHLVGDPAQGAFFKRGDRSHMAATLVDAVSRLAAEPDPEAARAERAAMARWLGYDRVVADLLRRMPIDR